MTYQPTSATLAPAITDIPVSLVNSPTLWAKVDVNGNPIGWDASFPSGSPARGARVETDAALAHARAANIGDVVAFPRGYHPRHGIQYSHWCRVR